MQTDSYPVLAEHPLAPAPRRLLRTTKREPSELPSPPPGAVLVFEVDGRRECVGRQHLTGAEPIVAHAVSVSVVSMREREVRVDLSVPSRSAADEFLITVGFHCRVVRPDVVAEAGLTDLVQPLREYLGRDHALLERCARFGVKDIGEVRTEAYARISAFCQVRPPHIDGMAVELATVLVYTPQPLREHETTLRDERWDQEMADLRRYGERANINYQAEVLRDAEAATATAVARGDMKAAEVVDRLYRERDERRTQLVDLVRSMAESGRLDRVPIDEKYLVDSLTRDLTGGLPPAEDRAAVPAVPRKSIGDASRTDENDPDRAVVYVDEDELSDD